MTTDPRRRHDLVHGSTAIGRAAMAAASATLKKVSMELGGKNPHIIFADADMKAAIDACVFGAYFNAGECCNAGSRILLQRDIADNFVAGLTERVKTVRVGDNRARDSRRRSPTIQRLGKIEGDNQRGSPYQERAPSSAAGGKQAATIRIGGERMASDDCLHGPHGCRPIGSSTPIANDEVFGPVVAAVMTFETLERSNQSRQCNDYGLSASVWSRDVDTAVGVGTWVRAGTIWVNTFMDGTPELPFGGYRQSGIGRSSGVAPLTTIPRKRRSTFTQGPCTSWWLPRT